MIDTLAFSRDRACQLDLLLITAARHAPHLDITVLYTASALPYEEGYAICRREHDVRWWSEANFEAQVREWLSFAGSPVAFLVDDDLFYRDAPEPPEIPFSYRPDEYWYPLALDGCIYDNQTIQGLLDFGFTDPNQLEAGLYERASRVPFSTLAGYGCLFGVPHNRVSKSPGAAEMGGDPTELNRRYLNGERISPELTLRGIEIVHAHQEVEYQWM